MLAVAGGKGGCGKTTTTLGLALAAARRDRTVLAVDADVAVPDLHRVAGIDGPDCHGSAGLAEPDRDRIDGLDGPRGRSDATDQPTRCPDAATAAPAARDDVDDVEPHPVPGWPRVDVLPARPGTDPSALRARIRATPGSYDMVVLDCPAGGGPDAAMPLRVADHSLLVTTSGDPSLRDAAKTAAMSRAVGTAVVGGVVTRADRVPEGVAALLGTTTIEAIPAARSPLRNRCASRRFTRILRRMSNV